MEGRRRGRAERGEYLLMQQFNDGTAAGRRCKKAEEMCMCRNEIERERETDRLVLREREREREIVKKTI